MAAPVDGYIQLPNAAGNTGKKDREQTRVVNSITVYEKILIRVRQAQLLGVYRAATSQQLILQAATNGTTTGLIWGHVPIAVSNKKVRLRRCYVTSQFSTAPTASPTAPRLRMDRITFTGTASGAAVTTVKNDSSYSSPIFDLRTAVTGLTVSLVAQLGNASVIGALTVTIATAWSPAVIDMFPENSEEDEWPIFAPGEGFVIYQDTAGTSTDSRLANICFVWDEIDTA